MSCQRKVGSTGAKCTNPAIYKDPTTGDDVCGIHQRKDARTDEYRLGQSPVRERAVKKKEIDYRGIYEFILQRFEDNTERIELDQAEIDMVRSLDNNDVFRFEAVMKCAIAKSGSVSSNLDFANVANHIPSLMRSFERAKAEKTPKIDREYFNPTIPAEDRIVYRNKQSEQLVNDNGFALVFEDIDVIAMNCTERYTGKPLTEWVKDPENIYVGPKGNGIEEDSKWFIPFTQPHETRYKTNPIWVQKILEDIEKGVESKEKYLALMGKNLGCVCLPLPCHCVVYAHVIKALLKKESSGINTGNELAKAEETIVTNTNNEVDTSLPTS